MVEGQVQAVSAVLITSVVIGAIGTVYVWGVPMLNKQQSQSSYGSFESNVNDLYEGIVSLSDSSQGSSDVIEVEANQVYVNESANYIDINKKFENSVGLISDFSLYKGSLHNTTRGAGSYAIKGENTPGSIFNRADEATGSEVTFRIDFRNLCEPSGNQMSLIDLEAEDGPRAKDVSSISITNVGTETDEDILLSGSLSGLECEGNYDRKRSIISVEAE
jgi:hypothetical protein